MTSRYSLWTHITRSPPSAPPAHFVQYKIVSVPALKKPYQSTGTEQQTTNSVTIWMTSDGDQWLASITCNACEQSSHDSPFQPYETINRRFYVSFSVLGIFRLGFPARRQIILREDFRVFINTSKQNLKEHTTVTIRNHYCTRRYEMCAEGIFPYRNNCRRILLTCGLWDSHLHRATPWVKRCNVVYWWEKLPGVAQRLGICIQLQSVRLNSSHNVSFTPGEFWGCDSD
jgi:hypothetical protein